LFSSNYDCRFFICGSYKFCISLKNTLHNSQSLVNVAHFTVCSSASCLLSAILLSSLHNSLITQRTRLLISQRFIASVHFYIYFALFVFMCKHHILHIRPTFMYVYLTNIQQSLSVLHCVSHSFVPHSRVHFPKTSTFVYF